MKDQKTKVLFLIEDQYQTKDGQTVVELLAVFPELESNTGSGYLQPGFVLCYANFALPSTRIVPLFNDCFAESDSDGCFCTAHSNYIKGLKPATEEQYNAVKNHLENIGYSLEILQA